MVALLFVTCTLASLAEGMFIKKYNSKHEKGGFIFTALISVFALAFFVVTDKGGITIPPQLWGYGIVSGVFYGTASLLTYVALSCGSFAMTMLILSYGLVFSIGYGLIFLNDPITFFTAIGLILMLVSIYFVKAQKDSGDKVKVTAKWLFCAFASLCLSGLFSVVQKMQQVKLGNGYSNEYMIVTLTTSAIILFTCGIIKDGKDIKYILKHGTLWTVGAGVANAITNLLTMVTNQMLPISVAAPVRAGTKIIISFLISMLIFKERFSKKQVVGVVLGTAALVFLNL